MFPTIHPETIMTDYEIALKNAFSIIYPESIQHACWFHYVQVCIIYLNKIFNYYFNYIS